MPRPLEFDRSEALEQAMRAFWRGGYGALSVTEVADAMGVAKSSLYNTFGSKRQLFIESVDHYCARQRVAVLDLPADGSVIHHLRHLLARMISKDNEERGCLLVNTTTEMALSDELVRRHVGRGFDNMHTALTSLIERGQRQGEFGLTLVAATAAASLLAGMSGLRVLSLAGFDQSRLSGIIDSLIAGLTA